MKVMMLQNHHFSPLLPLIQTFSKTRGIFNRAASEARSEAAASDYCLFLMWFQKTKTKIKPKCAGKAAFTMTLPSRLTSNSTFSVKIFPMVSLHPQSHLRRVNSLICLGVEWGSLVKWTPTASLVSGPDLGLFSGTTLLQGPQSPQAPKGTAELLPEASARPVYLCSGHPKCS